MRLLFMGTSHFAASILRALAEDGRFAVKSVYGVVPKPSGRGQRRQKPSAVAALAGELGLDAPRMPASLAAPEEEAFLRSLDLDAGVVADFGALLPANLLPLPRHGFLNAHPSLLPRWRGAAPMERAIMAGDSHTGVCIMKMTAALDAGDVFTCERTAIGASETAGELRLRLAPMAAAAMIRTLRQLQDGSARAIPQGEKGLCYAAKLRSEEGRLDWRLSAEELERRIRACTPKPGAWFETLAGGRILPSSAGASETRRRIRIAVAKARVAGAAAEAAAEEAPPGVILENASGEAPLVACGAGALELLQLQREGRKNMPAAEFLRGFPLPPGLRLPCASGA